MPGCLILEGFVFILLLLVLFATLMIKKAHPAFRFVELRLHMGHRFRCSILAKVVLALLEAFGLPWEDLRQA